MAENIRRGLGYKITNMFSHFLSLVFTELHTELWQSMPKIKTMKILLGRR